MKFSYKGKKYRTRKWVDYLVATLGLGLLLAFTYWYLWIYYPCINNL